MIRNITILGMGPSAIERRWDLLRYIQGTELWTLNNAYVPFAHLFQSAASAKSVVSAVRWFELHSWAYLKTWDAGVPDHFDKLHSLQVPVYVSEPLPRIRRQHLVDWISVFEHFAFPGTGGQLPTPTGSGSATNYFLGSPSLMLALAIWEHDHGLKIARIQSYGIDTSDERHKQQRHSWAYWCSQAHARGIELGGTMVDYMTEPDMDAGLVGLRESIGDAIEKRRSNPNREPLNREPSANQPGVMP